MCGINGIFYFEPSSVRPGAVERMNDVLAHRGPDAKGTFSGMQVALGHRRLSIIDTSESANQPLYSSDENYVIVFNGEIYNFRDIKKQLSGYPFKTQADTEVVLAAYIKYGATCVHLLNGIFAFAIWDKSKKELFISRDRSGIKPLYYYADDRVLVFSSSLRAILSTGFSSRKISRTGLVDYLRYQTVHSPGTIVGDVLMLPAGHSMLVNDEEGAVIKPYWTPTQATRRLYENVEQVHSAVRDQLSKSVAMQLVSDVPFGAFLSGGIDSSLLVALMSQVQKNVETFSVVFKEAEFSEREFSRLIAKKFGTQHHEIELGVEEFKTEIPTALSFMDHPSGDGPNTYVVSKKTREAGVKMALSGLGGDELFAGYPIFTQLPELRQKKWLRSFAVFLRRPFAKLYHTAKGTVASAKISALLQLEEFEIEDIYPVYRQVLMDDEVHRILNFPSLPPNRVREIAKELVAYKSAGHHLPELSKISLVEMATYMENVLLRDADQMSMANGLEVRVPFLDHDLIELVLGIDDRFKRPLIPMAIGTKKLLVDSFSDLLPPEIYNRPKMGFVLPYEKWMREDLREFCHTRITDLGNSEHFHSKNLQDLWKRFLKGDRRVTWSRIWPLVVLSNWLTENDVR